MGYSSQILNNDMQFSKEKSSVSSGFRGTLFSDNDFCDAPCCSPVLPAEKGYIIYRPSQGRRVRHKPRVCQGLSGLSIIDWCFPSSYFVEKNNWYLVTFAHMVGFMMKSMKVPVFFLQSPLIVDKPPFWWLEAPSSSNIHLCCVNLHSCYSSLKPPFFLLKPQFLWFTLW